MICKFCKKEIPDDSQICPECNQVTEELYSSTESDDSDETNKIKDETVQNGPEKTSVNNQTNNGYERKSKIVAGILAIFLGSLGIHNFYLGNNNIAFIQLGITIVSTLLSCCTFGLSGLIVCIVWIWAFVEGIMILCGKINTDANGVPLKDS